MPAVQVAPTETPGTQPETTNVADTGVAPATTPPVKHDEWSQTARGILEAIDRDLKVSKRLDELLARPI
jgi:hypothetical protein